MPHMRDADNPDTETARPGARFEITGTDAAAGVLLGTGDPALDAGGRPRRAVYVEILDAATGRTWFGMTRSWARRGGLWHWSLDLALAADTADGDSGFGRALGAFEILAYVEERDPDTGGLAPLLAAPVELTVVAPKALEPTDSVSTVLNRIRELSERRGPHAHPVGPGVSMLPEDRFVFVG